MPFSEHTTHVVVGFMLELTPSEVKAIKEHVAKLTANQQYKEHVSLQTINPTSNRPEVAGVEIFNLSDAAAGKVPLLHKDQKNLFKRIETHFAKIAALQTKQKPSLKKKFFGRRK